MRATFPAVFAAATSKCTNSESSKSLLCDAESGEILAYFRHELHRCGDIGLAAALVAALYLGKPASIQGAGMVRIDLQRRVVLIRRHLEVPELQLDEAAGIEAVEVARRQFQGLVAVMQGVDEVLAEHGAG